MLPETDEAFESEGQPFMGTLTSFDLPSEAGTPGLLTRVHRLLIGDEISDGLSEKAVIRRTVNGESFEIKNRIRSGVGITELDLAKVESSPFERNF
jgi:hypothetical protein